MKKLMFKAFLPHTIDLPELWFKIEDHSDVHLGGENGCYTVKYLGETSHGSEVLRIILDFVEEYSITLQAFQEVENVQEEKVETEDGEASPDSA